MTEGRLKEHLLEIESCLGVLDCGQQVMKCMQYQHIHNPAHPGITCHGCWEVRVRYISLYRSKSYFISDIPRHRNGAQNALLEFFWVHVQLYIVRSNVHREKVFPFSHAEETQGPRVQPASFHAGSSPERQAFDNQIACD